MLDICAAPGGKSTELAAKLHGTGLLVSNDISASRAKALLKNLEVFGAENALIISEAPYKLAERFHEYFDKILIDAPCSGEGMFRKSVSMITAWENNGNQLFADLQRSILDQVVTMLKPGGMLLYSTCTFAPLKMSSPSNICFHWMIVWNWWISTLTKVLTTGIRNGGILEMRR